nr:MAG TPA: hypothetical protein [Caudoviricetes sp.]
MGTKGLSFSPYSAIQKDSTRCSQSKLIGTLTLSIMVESSA